MITIIKLQEKAEKTLFSKKIKLSQVHENGVSYSLLELKKQKLLHSRGVRQLVGGNKVILTEPLKNEAVKYFGCADDRIYSYRLMRGGLSALLERNPAIRKDMTAVLVDIQCRYQELADILLRHFNRVRIITNRKELYEYYVTSKLYHCGATVILSDSFQQDPQTVLCVSPDGILFPGMNNGEIPVISAKKVEAANTLLIHSFRTQTPAEYAALMPEGVDAHAFQTALFDCGIRKLSSFRPTFASVNDVQKNIADIKINLFAIDIK